MHVYVQVVSQTAAGLHLKLWFSSACNANITSDGRASVSKGPTTSERVCF